jgi:hypothetical protein
MQNLGCTALLEGVTMDPEKLKSIQEWPPPEVRSKLRCYCQRFIAGFADIASSRQTHGRKRTFQCSPEREATFWLLKKLLCMTPILGYMHLCEKFTVNTEVNCHKCWKTRNVW